MKEKFFIGGLAILFFIIYCWYNVVSPPLFNSPDETAYNFFITRYIANGDFFAPAPLNNFLE
ncbi:hypothetical protein L6259_02515, partial [Candidatus Parcubacteria bacterium]|nr:hypothetical protein [Candidatus Parcubacteria bacterium]